MRRNSSIGSTSNQSVSASTKPIKRNSSLQSTPKISRQNSPSHSQRYSKSTPGSPLLVKSYGPQAIQMNSLFRSKSSTDKNNASLKTLLTKSNTYPNDNKNVQNQQNNQTQKGLLSRFIKSLTKKRKEKKLASIEEEMPEKANVSKEQMTTASLEAQEKKKKKEQENPNQTVLEKQNKTVRGKQNQTVLGILREKQKKSGKQQQQQQQQTMPFESVEMPKKKVILSNRKELLAFFEKADATSENQMALNENCPAGEASLRHFMNSDGKIERALSSPTVKLQGNPDQAEKEEIPGESSYRFSSSPDFLKKLKATSEDEGSDKSSFGFPSPADSVPITPTEPWWQIQSNGQGEIVAID
ncbi:hypothetical protein niasHT_039927 [Heterodera trifolii]|uniref:Uncharacterized protein n=1 Tax=Heterodera trifolii TaxID=157864 RepID=A0ABD2IB41_9BILA